MNTKQHMRMLSLLTTTHNEYKIYIYNNYLNSEDISLCMREFYSESPSWFMNHDIEDMKNTIHWSTMDHHQKSKLLDDDLDEYFQS